MRESRTERIQSLAALLDAAVSGEPTSDALAAARSFVEVLERRLETEAAPLDLFTLPGDLPRWEALYADLLARAIVETGSIAKAAGVVGVGRATLYAQIQKGVLNAHLVRDPALRRLVGGTAPDLAAAAG